MGWRVAGGFTLSTMRILDLHQDLLHYFYRHGDDGILQRYPDYGIGSFVMAIFPFRGYYESSNVEDAFRFATRSIENIYRIADRYGWRVALRGDEVGERSIIVGLEGGYGLEETNDLRTLWRLGLRLLGLVWNKDNPICASWKAQNDYGLTDFGHEIVKEALERGIVIDLAHASDGTFFDVVSSFEGGIMVSHTGLRHMKDLKRNITVRMVEEIARKGGIVGIAFAKLFLGEVSMEKAVAEISALVKDFPDTIAVGSDFFGFGKSMEIEGMGGVEDFPAIYRAFARHLDEELLDKFFWRNAAEFFRRFMG